MTEKKHHNPDDSHRLIDVPRKVTFKNFNVP